MITAINGLSDEEVIASRRLNGQNTVAEEEQGTWTRVLLQTAKEPMFIILLIACSVYFLLRQYEEGIIMLVAILIVSGISFFQEYRSRNAVEALRKLSLPKTTVIRNGGKINISSEDIVVNDIMWLSEGQTVAADGVIVSANDLSLNESVITGESFPVSKKQNGKVYKGTLLLSGSATIRVTEVGSKTVFGKIGASLAEITEVKTPLQQSVKVFIRRMLWFGSIAFLLVFGINFYQSQQLFYGLLQGLTLAMSVLPEEIPVAFTTFQALGAYRLLQNNIIVKQPQYVETLGSATVICLDKTGTLTQNRMSIAYLYNMLTKRRFLPTSDAGTLSSELIEYAMWASERVPFDPMEKSIHDLYTRTAMADKRKLFAQVYEYPISGKPPMMTHIFQNAEGKRVIACKGAPEAILRLSHLPADEQNLVEQQLLLFAKQGYRVLGVGKGEWRGTDYPASQQNFPFHFLGLIAFDDPAKPHIKETIQSFRDAGIAVKIITGDFAETTAAIAKRLQIENAESYLTGSDVMSLSDDDLKRKVKSVNLFARMFPEAKLRVINALKKGGEVVAMTGDGVNDAPALKAAHIGVAMGQRGSEVAKAAASLIISDDDLSHMTAAIAVGRKIYDNIKKAVQYIVSIHIPIVLIVTLPLLLQWKYENLFTPVHVIFLELLMGPTCSIIYENEPMEKGTMNRKPRRLSSTFLSVGQLKISFAQGLAITVGCLSIGFFYVQQGESLSMVRTVVFITLLFSNIFLTLVNRSFRFSLFTTLRYKNYLVPLIVGFTLLSIAAFLYIPFIRSLFWLQPLSLMQIFISFSIAAICTLWIEFFKSRNLSSFTNHH